jgi:hypothetical protein
VVDSHSSQPLARGFLPFRPARGTCEIRGGAANLWYAAVKALGFVVTTLRYPDPIFVGHLTVFCAGAKSLNPPPGRFRQPRQLPTVVFSDLASLPLVPEYWEAWTTTHVFYCFRADKDCSPSSSEARGAPPLPPRGWSACSVSLAHSATGGSTSGKWTFVVWYPPGLPWVEPLTWEPRGGTPLLCCVNDREYARPFLGPRGSGAVGAVGAVVAGVVRTEGLVLDFGLFPASDPSARVIVETSSSPSGYGTRDLTVRELGNLWDIPILFLDSLPDPDVGGLMGAICASPPSKLLHTGADLLLTDFFRGGGVGSAMGKGSGGGRAAPGGVGSAMGKGSGGGRAGMVPPGPRPLSDRELGIKRAAPPQNVISPEKRPRVGVPPQDVQDVVSPEKRPAVTKGQTVPPQDLPHVSTTGEVTKGDSQKADNASVPDHLWLRAFVVGYGYEACAARHREALTLPTGFVGVLGTTEPPAGWRGAIPGFRLFALRFWRARTTQGYTAWRKANVPLTPSGGGKMVQYRWQALTRPVYDWTDRGRKLYQAEWRTLRSHPEGRATVEAGYDAIHRCADVTGPPFLELGEGIPASNTGRAAPLHDRLPRQAIHAEAG